MPTLLITVIGCAAVLFSAFGAVAAEPAGFRPVLSIGRATEDVVKTTGELAPLAELLAGRLSDLGVRRGEVRLAGDNKAETIIAMLRDGRLDIVAAGAFGAWRFQREAGAVPLALAWRGGMADARSLVFVRSDGPVSTVEDLVGRVVAFEDPRSTSSFFLPKCSLMARGYRLAALPSPEASVPEGAIGYVFAGSELNISSWVYFGKVAAGALDVTNWARPDQVPPQFKEAFRPVHETEALPRFLFLARSDLGAPAINRIRRELLSLPDSAVGREALAGHKITNVTTLARGTAHALDTVTELADRSGCLDR